MKLYQRTFGDSYPLLFIEVTNRLLKHGYEIQKGVLSKCSVISLFEIPHSPSKENVNHEKALRNVTYSLFIKFSMSFLKFHSS